MPPLPLAAPRPLGRNGEQKLPLRAPPGRKALAGVTADSIGEPAAEGTRELSESLKAKLL